VSVSARQFQLSGSIEVVMDAPTDVATLLGELDLGNDKAVAELVVLLYSELRSLASGYLRRERSDHTLQTTALVHEAYLRLADQREVHWKNREQFLGVAAQLMRRILVDYSRGHGAQKRGKGFERVFLEEAEVISKNKAADVIALDEALTRLAGFDPQQARLVELRFFGGLSIEESAGVLGVSRTTLKRDWNLAKAWLARELRKGDQKDA
jgi:RNA polymerase sigma-70 factor (ECF subfamily)